MIKPHKPIECKEIFENLKEEIERLKRRLSLELLTTRELRKLIPKKECIDAEFRAIDEWKMEKIKATKEPQ